MLPYLAVQHYWTFCLDVQKMSSNQYKHSVITYVKSCFVSTYRAKYSFAFFGYLFCQYKSKTSFQPYFLRPLFHTLNRFPNNVIQLHFQHFTTAADCITIYTCSKRTILKFLLNGLNFQIKYAFSRTHETEGID